VCVASIYSIFCSCVRGIHLFFTLQLCGRGIHLFYILQLCAWHPSILYSAAVGVASIYSLLCSWGIHLFFTHSWGIHLFVTLQLGNPSVLYSQLGYPSIRYSAAGESICSLLTAGVSNYYSRYPAAVASFYSLPYSTGESIYSILYSQLRQPSILYGTLHTASRTFLHIFYLLCCFSYLRVCT
jgi:hypothetical protein